VNFVICFIRTAELLFRRILVTDCRPSSFSNSKETAAIHFSVSNNSVFFFGAIVTRKIYSAISIDYTLLLSADTIFDRVYGIDYVGLNSHSGGRDYRD